MDKRFQLVTIFEKPVLFTCERIKRAEVPEGLYCYDIRHDDYCSGKMTELKDYVMVNHWGTVLSKEPFEPREQDGFLRNSKEGIFIDDEDYNYLSEELTIEEYSEQYDELIQNCSGQEQNGDSITMWGIDK